MLWLNKQEGTHMLTICVSPLFIYCPPFTPGVRLFEIMQVCDQVLAQELPECSDNSAQIPRILHLTFVNSSTKDKNDT